MKNIKKISITVFAFLLLYTTLQSLSASASEYTNLNFNKEVPSTSVNTTITSNNVLNNTNDKTPILDLNSITIDKTNVTPGNSIHMTLSISNTSELNEISLCYRSPVTHKNKYVYFTYNPDTNLYEGTLTIDESMENGTWTINFIRLDYGIYDINYFFASDYDFSKLNFTINNGNNDTTPPVLDFNSMKIDKTNVTPGDIIHMTLNAYDTSGINDISLCYISPITSKNKYLDFSYNPVTKLYEATLTIDSSMENGTWSVNSINLTDNFDNNTYIQYFEHDFSSLNFTVSNSDPDITAPNISLDSISIDNKCPKYGDSIHLTLNASDDKSGINNISLCYKSPITSINKYIDFTYNPKTGLYEGVLKIDDSIENGTWTVIGIGVSDNSYNYTYISNDDHDFSDLNFTVNNTAV